MEPKFFRSAAEFHGWLGKNHERASELLLGFYKRATGRGITYPEALDEALSFGWIDGVRKRIDDESYSIRFTPRKRDSTWSQVNIRRAKELIRQGRMQPPGLRVFGERDEHKTRRYSYEREQSALTPELDSRLRANPKAAAFFDAQPPGYRKIVTFWIMSAKQEETRTRRLSHLIERSEAESRIDLLKPNR